jgi:hypothetical protein
VEELVNISEPADSRREETRSRTLKLLLTDGLQTMAGLEVRSIKDLHVNSPAGIKVLCENFEIRRGIALFGPDNLKVVGGMVADLERSRLERIERLESAKKRRQLVPVMPPPAPEGEQSQQPPPGRPVQGVDEGALQPVFSARRDVSIVQSSEAPHRVAGHEGASLFAGAPVRLGGPHSRAQHSAGPAEMPSRNHAPQHPEIHVAGQAAGPLPGAIRSIGLAMAVPEDVAMRDVDPDEQAPEVPRPPSAPSPQLPLLPPQPAGGARCSLSYMRQLQMDAGGASAGGREWVQVAVMGIGRLDCSLSEGGYSLLMLLVDGTARVWVRAGDAVLEGLIGIPSDEYVQRGRLQTKPQRVRLAAILSRLEGRFCLTPCADPGDVVEGGEEQVPLFEVLEIDPGPCRGMAWALVERVERGLAGRVW